jgi:hypothetical protein
MWRCTCCWSSLYVVCIVGMTNLLCFFNICHAINVDYMILKHADIVKLVWTCYGLDEHAFNAIKLHDVMYSMMIGV